MAKNIAYYNLTGGLNTVQGIGTINQTPNRTESPDMLNVEYYKLGGLKTMNGNRQFGSTLPSKITFGYEYIYGNDSYLIVTTYDGTVYIYDRITQAFKEIYKFPTPSNDHNIISFNNGIVITNGIDDLVYYMYGRHDQLTGTVTGIAQSYDVTGTGTKFKTQLSPGDRIQIGALTYQVSEITSDTELKLTTTIAVNFTDEDYYLTEISELNAVLVNEDDPNISQTIRGLAIASYKGRIWVGANDGTLYYSELGLIHGWDIKYDAGGIPQFYDDNSDFTALGNWSKYLTIHKRENTYILDANNEDSGSWSIEPYSDYSCDGPHSFTSANNGYYVYARAAGGIYAMFSRSLYNTLYQAQELSIKIRDSFRDLNISAYDKIFPVYHPLKKYLMFYMPLLTGIGSNDCFIFDIQTKSWLRRRVPQNVTTAFQYEKKVYIGTQDGKVLEEFAGTTFDGEPIDFYWKSPFFIYGGGTNWTTTREFRLKLSEEGATNCQLNTYRDGSSIPKSRRVSSNRQNLLSLVWDIGYNQGDFYYTGDNVLPETLTVYKFTGSDGNIYYSTDFPNEETPVKLYSDPDCTEFVNYSNLIYKLVEGTEEDFNYVENTEHNCYAYARATESTVPSYRAFVSDNDSRIVAWVSPDDTDHALINQVPEQYEKVSYYGFSMVQSDGTLAGYFLVAANDYEKYWNTPNVWLDTYNTQGQLNYINGNRLQVWTSYNPNGTAWKNQQGRSLCAVTASGAALMIYGVSGRYSPYDKYEAGTRYVWNGTEDINNTEVYNVSSYSNTAISVNGVTFRRDDDKDILDPSMNIIWVKYAADDPLEVGDWLYNDTKCTNKYATVQSIEDDTYWMDTTKTVGVIRYTVRDGSYYTQNYQKKELVTYTLDTEYEYSISNPNYFEYPTTGLTDNLTETVWDEYSWYKSEHITKRFPLPDQYFQSLQIEFSGQSTEDNLCIYGFEIDGIELTEVPY